MFELGEAELHGGHVPPNTAAASSQSNQSWKEVKGQSDKHFTVETIGI
jgi:hypothetical protein